MVVQGQWTIDSWARNNVRVDNEYFRGTIAELFGTLILCFMGTGAGFYSVLSKDSRAVTVFGSIFGLMVAQFVFGAQLNPAVSLSMAVAGKMKWAKVPIFASAQFLGGYIGSLLSYALYKDHLFTVVLSNARVIGKNDLDSLNLPDLDMKYNNARILSAFSPSGSGTFLGVGIVTEITLTAIFLMAIMSLGDKGRNMEIPSFLFAFLLCLTAGGLAMCHGIVTGSLLNPARHLAPRFAAYTLGWSRQLCFQNVNFNGETQEWWIVSAFGTTLGAVLGVVIYIFAVGAHLANK